MKIGFNLLLWTTHLTESQFGILGTLAKVGYNGVEIPIFDPSDPAHFAKIGQALKDNGLESTAVTVCPEKAKSCNSADKSDRDGALEHLKRVIDCGHKAGIKLLCGPYYQVLGDFTGNPVTRDEWLRGAEVHRPLADYAQQAGITLAIEPLNRFEAHFLNTMQQAREYVKLVDHPNFWTMYDTFHANIEEKQPLAALTHGMDVVRHIHISANDRGTPGRDHTPIRETVAIARQHGYQGYFTIEAFGSALPDLAAATRVWRDLFTAPEEVYTEGYALLKSCAG